jgi:hypothetical protein
MDVRCEAAQNMLRASEMPGVIEMQEVRKVDSDCPVPCRVIDEGDVKRGQRGRSLLSAA